jgi:translocation and assembly module TamB
MAVRGRIWKVLLAMAAAFIVLLLVFAWLLGRERTLQYAIDRFLAQTNGEITMLGTRGGLYEGIAFERLQMRGKNQLVTLEQGVIRWEPGALLTRSLLITQANVKKISIEITGSSDEPMAEPKSLALPISLIAPEVKVDAIEIRQGEQITRLNSLALALRYSSRWELERLGLETPWGAIAGTLQLDGARPFSLTGDLSVVQDKSELMYATNTKLAGTLADVRSNTTIALKTTSGAAASGKVSARLAPFTLQPLAEAEIDIPGFSPRSWNADWLDAKLSLKANLTPAREAGAFNGQVKIANEAAGTIDQQRVPLLSAAASFSGNAKRVELSGLAIDLGSGGQFSGTGEWREGNARLNLQTQNFNLKGVHTKLKPTAIRGEIALVPQADAWRVTGRLSEQKLSLQVDADVTKGAVNLERALLTAGKGVFDAKGQMKLTGQSAFNVAGNLKQFNPAELGEYPAADLNADIKLEGLAEAAWQVRADIALGNSRLVNRPLSGKAKFAASAQSLRDVDVDLLVGGNRLTARGGFGLDGLQKAQQKLVWNIEAPRLAELSSGLSGNLSANGEAEGSLNAAVITASLEGRDLRILSAHRIKLLNGRARIEVKDGKTADAQIKADITANEYQSANLSLKRATLALEGSRAAHVLKLSAGNADIDLKAEASGGLDAGNLWRGQIVNLDNRGGVPFSLKAPVALTAGLPVRVDMGIATVDIGGGNLRIAGFRFSESGLTTRGSANGLPLALAVSFSDGLKRKLESTLKLGADWDIATNSAGNAGGSLRVFRESGDVVFLADSRLPAGLEQLEFRTTLADNQINASLNALGRQLGSIRVDATTRAEARNGAWGIPASAPLLLKGEVDVPKLAWVSRLASEPGLTVDGALRASVVGEGTFGSPRLRGQANGKGLLLRWADQGLNYRNGEFDAEFSDDSLNVKRLTMLAGEGRMEAEGNLSISGTKTSGKLAAKLDRFEAVSRPDRLVVASGEGTLQLDDNRLSITGKLRADRGFFELPEKSEVVLSDDIVIVGKTAGKDAPRMKTRVDLNLDLGEQFKVRGAGLNGRLAGTMRVVSADTGLPRAVGTLRIEDGTYTVYGQKLTVERGLLSFAGPIHNPGINLLAVRKALQTGVGVEAGVEVTGSANTPKAKLVSTPNVSETEKLSWLVLGRGLENSSKADFGLLSAAASGLLGSSQGASIQSKIASSLGVDEIGISPAGAGQEGFLSVGKRISSKLYATYEQGLGKVSNVFKIRYTISPRWSLQAQAGTESAADVLYTITFD